MKLAKDAVNEILEHIKSTVDEIDGLSVEQMVQTLFSSRRVFVFGAGRSFLVAKSFAMRLVHLGFNVFIVGETITPKIEIGDVLLLVTGSGMTQSVVLVAQTAKKTGAKIVALTSNKESSVGKLADCTVVIGTKTNGGKVKDYLQDQLSGKDRVLSPMGTLFEDTCQVFLDGIIVEMMEKAGKTEEDMKKIHTSLE